MTEAKHTNRLITETSPYLLQHARNPVKWFPWGKEALEKAAVENKPIIISIGYAACHWCHVMEKETFEDPEAASVMNEHYVCIKVDREERPDIDQVYMDAVQLMNRQGGWPLNVIALPDGRPFFGGTYFPRTQWIGICREISGMFQMQYDQLEKYATRLTEGVAGLNPVAVPEITGSGGLVSATCVFEKMQKEFDVQHGGLYAKNKFPMPDVFSFLLQYHIATKDRDALRQLELTLDAMALGGIYDQVGGGFCRYSTDFYWKVPHFEKMLYDNAQLLGLYANAWQVSHVPLYKQVVYQTWDFIRSELKNPGGGYFSSIDADSEGEEGRFYAWKEQEAWDLLGDDFFMVADYFGIGKAALWEDEKNVLLIAESIDTIAAKYKLSSDEARKKISAARSLMLAHRNKRVRPATDDKVLVSWNCLLACGLVEAYRVFNDTRFLEAAGEILDFIETRMFKKGRLHRSFTKGKVSVHAFLDDYALLIRALLLYYDATFSDKHLVKAKQLLDYVIDGFYDAGTSYFCFTEHAETELFSKKTELGDNVIASSNSIMANNLFISGKLLAQQYYVDMAQRMLHGIQHNLEENPSFFSNWAKLLLCFEYPFYEVAITGTDAGKERINMEKKPWPFKVVAGCTTPSDWPLLKDRFAQGKTLFYICEGNFCRQPVDSAGEALEYIPGENI